MKCRHCSFDNAADARFCEQCGQPLGGACPSCGAPVPSSARFCRRCGFNLAGPAPAAVTPLPPPAAAADHRAAPRPVEGERKQVTLLFTDIVGSTALAEQLDPEDWAEIVAGAHQRVSEAVAHYDGTIAQLLGDGVLAFFGAPVTHEDDPVRAVAAALDILAATSAYAAELRTHRRVATFQMRVGLNTGLVVVGNVGSAVHMEYLAVGDSVNLAARLQAAAQPDTVLISASTARRVRHAFDLEPCGPFDLKGKAEPVAAFRVVGRKAMPGLARGLEGLRSPLVGRDAEYQLLRAKLAEGQAGRGAFVTVTGEAGLGKSRLVAEVRKLIQADAEPAISWLEGRAISYGQAITYHPWRQVIRQAIGAQEGEAPESVREKLRCGCDCCAMPGGDLPFLETMLAVESETTAQAIMGLAGDALVQHITDAIRGYICAHAQMAPTVVVFDDLHWADSASLELLLNIADLVEDWPLLIICLLRPDREAPSWSLIQRVRDRLATRYVEIALEPLGAEYAQELLGNLLYIEDLPESVRALILKKSEGNPFFLEEVIRALIDSGHIVQEQSHWRATRAIAEVAIPDTLAGVLSARIDRLPDETKRVAQTAAVLGRIFASRVLTAMCATAAPYERIEDIEPHLGTLTYEELVRERRRDPELEYIFKHALTQETAYDLLLLKRRKELHRRAGEALVQLYAERLDELAPMLARHYWLGEAWAQTVDFSLRAGRRAVTVYALHDALEHYNRAHQALERLRDAPPQQIIETTLAWTGVAYKLRLYEDEPQREEMLRRLAHAEGIARALNDKARLAETLVWIANVYILAGYPGRAMTPLAESSQLASELGEDRLSILPLFITTLGMVDSDPRNAVDQLARVIELARKHASPDIEAHALGLKALAHARLGDFAAAQEMIGAALARVSTANSPVKEADVHITVGMAYFDIGDVARGLEHTRRGAELALGARGLECACAGYLYTGLGNLLLPNLVEARQALEEALRLSQFATFESLRIGGRAGLAIAQFLATQRDEAIQEMEQVLVDARATGDDFTAAFLSQALGEAHAHLGRYDQAQHYLGNALEFYRRTAMRPYLARALESLARLYEAQGDDVDAQQARTEAHQVRQPPAPLSNGPQPADYRLEKEAEA